MDTDIKVVESFGSLLKKEALTIMPDIVEGGLDLFIENDIIKELPFFGTGIGLIKGTLNIRDRHLLEKAFVFINEFRKGQIDIAYRSTVMNNPKEYNKFIERILIYLDRYTDVVKSEYLSKCVHSFLSESINENEFVEYMDIIDRLYIDDFDSLYKTYSDSTEVPKYHKISRLANSFEFIDRGGLMIMGGDPTSTVFKNYTEVNLTKLGKSFCENVIL